MHSGEDSSSREDEASSSNDEEDEREEYPDGIELEWVESEKGKEKVSQMEQRQDCDLLVSLFQAVFKGAIYTFNKQSARGDQLFLVCDKREGCRSRLGVDAESRKLLYRRGSHNHAATPWRPNTARVREEQRKLAVENTDVVCSSALVPLHPSLILHLGAVTRRGKNYSQPARGGEKVHADTQSSAEDGPEETGEDTQSAGQPEDNRVRGA